MFLLLESVYCQALVAHACDLNTQETEQQECCEFEASLK